MLSAHSIIIVYSLFNIQETRKRGTGTRGIKISLVQCLPHKKASKFSCNSSRAISFYCGCNDRKICKYYSDKLKINRSVGKRVKLTLIRLRMLFNFNSIIIYRIISVSVITLRIYKARASISRNTNDRFFSQLMAISRFFEKPETTKITSSAHLRHVRRKSRDPSRFLQGQTLDSILFFRSACRLFLASLKGTMNFVADRKT